MRDSSKPITYLTITFKIIEWVFSISKTSTTIALLSLFPITGSMPLTLRAFDILSNLNSLLVSLNRFFNTKVNRYSNIISFSYMNLLFRLFITHKRLIKIKLCLLKLLPSSSSSLSFFFVSMFSCPFMMTTLIAGHFLMILKISIVFFFTLWIYQCIVCHCCIV